MTSFEKCKICSSDNIKGINAQFKLAECQECGLVFCQTCYSDKEIENVYDKLYNKSKQYEKHQQQHIQIAQENQPKLGRNKNKILKFLLKQGCNSILEIGAGVGIVAHYWTFS